MTEQILRNATDVYSREAALDRIVRSDACTYCEFQVVLTNSSSLADDLARIRLDRPVLIYDAVRPVKKWRVEYFLSESRFDNANVSVIEMPTGPDALLPFPEYIEKHRTEMEDAGADTGGYAGSQNVLLHAQRWMSVRKFADLCARGEARNLIVTNNVLGERFSHLYEPWLGEDYLDEIAPVHGALEDAAWEAGIPQVFVAGPWDDATERIKRWVQLVHEAPDAEKHARVREFDRFRKRVREVKREEYLRDAANMSGTAMRNKYQRPDDSFTIPPVLFMGQHLSGLYSHAHQRASQSALHGYRFWYTKSLDAREREEEPFASAFDYFIHSFDRKKDEARYCPDNELRSQDRHRCERGLYAVCCQPPGSLVLLPEQWQHSVIGWAEDERGGPVPIDHKGGMTISMSYQ